MAFGGYRAKHLPPSGSRRGRLLKAGDTFRIGECDKTFIVHLGMSQSAASASSAASAEWHQIARDRFRALTRSHGRCSWRTDRGFETEQHTQRRDVARRVASVSVSVPALARFWHWPGAGTGTGTALARHLRRRWPGPFAPQPRGQRRHNTAPHSASSTIRSWRRSYRGRTRRRPPARRTPTRPQRRNRNGPLASSAAMAAVLFLFPPGRARSQFSPAGPTCT